METQYYYLREGQRFGPISPEQMKEIAASGWLRSHDLVWAESLPDWIPAEKVKGLFPSAASAKQPGFAAPRTTAAAASKPAAPGATKPAAPASTPRVKTASPTPRPPTQWGLLGGAAACGLAALVCVVLLVMNLTRTGDGVSTEDDVADSKDAGGDGKFPQLNPKAESALGRGDAALLKGNSDEAIREYSEALKLQPGWAWAHRKRAEAHMNKKDFTRAIVDCDEALKLDTNLLDAHAFRASAQFNLEDYDGAIRSTTRGLEVGGKSAYFYYLRGVSLIHKTRFEKAVADLDQAIGLDAKNAEYFNYRGFAHENLGDKERAAADYSERDRLQGKTATVKPDPSESKAKRDAKQKLDEAEAALKQARTLYAAEEARHVKGQAENGKRKDMGLPPLEVRPQDPKLAQGVEAARKGFQEALKAYEEAP